MENTLCMILTAQMHMSYCALARPNGHFANVSVTIISSEKNKLDREILTRNNRNESWKVGEWEKSWEKNLDRTEYFWENNLFD